MNLYIKIKRVLKKPQLIVTLFNEKGMLKILSDRMQIKLIWWSQFGKKINLNNPKTFCEKLQWLKLYDHNPLYSSLVDKYAVRQYVANKIGTQYLIPLLGVWESPDEIDFSSLPNEFVLKCNHNSGLGMCICSDKSKLDIEKVKNNLTVGLNKNHYYLCREWAYKNVKPKIVAEKFMSDDQLIKKNIKGLIDYKFYCFNGKPRFLYVGYANIINNEKHDLMTFYMLDWEKAPFYRLDHEELFIEIEKPELLNEMIDVAKKLSEDIPFVRVDLYYINKKIYFSELTLCPGGGYGTFSPEAWEEKIGEWLELPMSKQLKNDKILKKG